MLDESVEEQLTGLVRRDFQSAGDALAAVMVATTAVGEAWSGLDTRDSGGRLLVRRWLEALWRGVSKIASDFDAAGFSITVVSRGQISVTFDWPAH